MLDTVIKIKITSVIGAHHLVCPTCRKPVYNIYPDRDEVPTGKTWLQDGETIPGLYQRLSGPQKQPGAFDFAIWIGTCRLCMNNYYVVTAIFMHGEHDAMFDYLAHNVELGPVSNFICSIGGNDANGLPTSCVKHEHSTKMGKRHEFVFGPWSIIRREAIVCGEPVGEPWEHAQTLLYYLWDCMRSESIPSTLANN